MMRIDSDVATFLRSGTTCIVSCSSDTGVPDLGMALACWPGEDDSLEIALDALEAASLLERLRQDNVRVAVVACRPTDLVTMQFKGGGVSFPPVDAQMLAAMGAALAAIKSAFGRIGLPPAYVDTLLQPAAERVTRLRLRVDEVFNQTPGPNAGQRRVAP
jgi:hypothetical protein